MQPTKTVKINFPGWKKNILDARLELPAEGPEKIKAYTVISNCFTCTKNTITTFRISKAMAQNGYASLRFDFSGLGNSEGIFSKTSFSSNVYEIVAASNFLREHYRAPSLLIGHSLGGTAALVAAMKINQTMSNSMEKVKSIVTIASPSQPDHILHHFGDSQALLDKGIPAKIDVANQQYEIEPSFIKDLAAYDMKKNLASLETPVLIFNIKNDELVDENNALELNRWINGDSKIITLENTNHLLSNKQDSDLVARKIVNWYESDN